MAEHAPLRHQLALPHRRVKHSRCSPADRTPLVLLARRVRAWRSALLIVRPDTLVRWHRRLVRGYWRRKSRAAAPAHRPPLAPETVALLRAMAVANRLWGAERIRGGPLELDSRVATSPIRRSPRAARPPRRAGQPRATFLRKHAPDSWACDFLPVTDRLFRPLYAFVVIALETRRVVHVGVTRHPTAARVAQQRREATPCGQQPRYLVRDNDRTYGPAFDRVAAASGIAALRTTYRAPRQNAACERFLGSVRRECLDHSLVLGETHLRRVLREYATYFNQDRPHRGSRQRIPGDAAAPPARAGGAGNARACPVLGGLHHAYQRAA